MSDIAIRLTTKDIFLLKCSLLNQVAEIERIDRDMVYDFEKINGYSPIKIEWTYQRGPITVEKYIDMWCWTYLVKLFHLQKYMLCTDYDKMMKQITSYDTPVFNVENADGWLDGLKEQVYQNVRQMLKLVYEKIITGTYYTGTGYNRFNQKKKRNNNGIDKWFILHTNDYQMMYSYWQRAPTITDDLEKACYILDGKTVPDLTIKEKMRGEKLLEGKNDYFEIRVCKNGHTHYRIFDETRDKLNKIGPDGNVIGENIKIKIFQT